MTTSPNVLIGTGGALSLTIANPSSNAFAITAFTVAAPTGWTFSGGATAEPASTYFDCTVTSGSVACSHKTANTGLPPSATDTVTGGTAALSLAPPTTGTAPFSGTFTSSVQDASSAAYYTGPSFITYAVVAGTTITVVLSPTATSFTAGGSAYTVTATVASGTAAQNGIPVIWSIGNKAKGTLSATSGTTDSNGALVVTFTPTNSAKAADNPNFIAAALGNNVAAAAAGATAFPSGSSAAVTTVAGTATKATVSFASSNVIDGNHYSTTKATPQTSGASPSAFTVNTGITYSLADAFGNPVDLSTVTISYTITISALSGGGLFDATGLPATVLCVKGANWKATLSGADIAGYAGALPATVAPTTACPTSGATNTLPFNYYQATGYSSIGKVSVAITGTGLSASGSSNAIVTSTFMGAPSPAPAAAPASVTAGNKANVSASVAPAQGGVPVTFFLDKAASLESAGVAYGKKSVLATTFSNGAKSITVTTNAAGFASALFTVDTVTGASAKFVTNVTAPTDASLTAVLGVGGDSAAAVTATATASKFTGKVTFDSGITLSASSGAASTTLYVDVAISDAYGNSATNTAGSQIQISLSASCGTSCPLSATSIYIANGCADTANPSMAPGCTAFGPVTWTMPTTTGTAAVLTASGVLNGATSTATSSVSVVSKLPTITVTSPKPLAGFIYSKSTSIVFTGQANASAGYAASGAFGVSISTVTYSIDGGAKQNAVFSSGNTVVFSVAATFTSGTHSIVFNGTDNKKNSVLSPAFTVLADTSAPTIKFVTAAGASLNAGSPVVATIVDTLGDLNSTSVTAAKNGTAIAASSVTVTGTNTPGTNATYTVNIAGLGAGTWTVSVNAKDLAGNAATAVSLKVHVSVPPNQSFTAPTSGPGSAQACTQQGSAGACVTWTNNLPTAQTVNLWFVWYNSKGQIVALGFQGATVAPGASSASFSSQSLPSGSYTVQTFITTSTGSAYSTSLPIPVTL